MNDLLSSVRGAGDPSAAYAIDGGDDDERPVPPLGGRTARGGAAAAAAAAAGARRAAAAAAANGRTRLRNGVAAAAASAAAVEGDGDGGGDLEAGLRPPPGGSSAAAAAAAAARARANGGTAATAAAATAAAAADKSRDMGEFFERADDLKQGLTDIKARQREIHALHERSKSMVRQAELQAARGQMRALVDGVNKAATAAKAKLEALEKLNAQALGKRGQGPGSASERTRTSITAGLKKKLKDLMGEFSDLRARIHEENRQVVERRVYTVTGQRLPEEDIDRMIETGEAETIFQKAILEQGRGRVLDTLAEIQERNRAVKDLEASLLELHQIFLDMAVLVEAQGEMLDNIEKQVARSVEYVHSGTTALQEAKTLQKKTRKWMCCAIVLLLVTAAVIVIVVVKPWQMVK